MYRRIGFSAAPLPLLFFLQRKNNYWTYWTIKAWRPVLK